jgi:hypothetical protein
MHGFGRRKIVAACIDDFFTRLCCNNCLQDIKYISNRAAIASNASYKKTLIMSCCFLFNHEQSVRSMFTIYCIVDFEGIETPGKIL